MRKYIQKEKEAILAFIGHLECILFYMDKDGKLLGKITWSK